MLKLYEYNTKDFTKGCMAILHEAKNVCISSEVNKTRSIRFEYPRDSEKAALIRENRIIVCEGQAYRILKAPPAQGGETSVSISGTYVYETDAKAVHIPTIPDHIGKSPRTVIETAFAGSGFHIMTDSELSLLGLKWVDHDGFLIDFFEVDKTTPFDVMEQVIENCGRGELYVDNYNVALVERIGKDRNLTLRLDQNTQSITVERDITNLVTRLYPYGYEDAAISSVNGGTVYIDSPNQGIYGVKCGYKDYPDYKEPADIYNNALWEFDERNPNRIDVPSVNISCACVDLYQRAGYQGEGLRLGDTVTVYDNGVKIRARVLRLEYYPYEPQKSQVEVGRPKKDLFFYMNQLGKLGHNYKRVSTISGQVQSNRLSGIINTSKNNVKSENGYLEVIDDRLRIVDKNKKVRLFAGNQSDVFAFRLYNAKGQTAAELTESGFVLYDKNGKPVITFDDEGNGVFAGTIRTDQDVQVGKRIFMETPEDSEITSYVKYGVVWMGDRTIGGAPQADGVICCTDQEMFLQSYRDIVLYANEGDDTIQISQLCADLRQIKTEISNIKIRLDALENKVIG